ncbi:DUF5989 family protein [Lutibacter sp. HS1-25]
MESFIEIFKFMFKKKKFYLIPIVIVMIFISLIVAALSVSYVAPFIYSIF